MNKLSHVLLAALVFTSDAVNIRSSIRSVAEGPDEGNPFAAQEKIRFDLMMIALKKEDEEYLARTIKEHPDSEPTLKAKSKLVYDALEHFHTERMKSIEENVLDASTEQTRYDDERSDIAATVAKCEDGPEGSLACRWKADYDLNSKESCKDLEPRVEGSGCENPASKSNPKVAKSGCYYCKNEISCEVRDGDVVEATTITNFAVSKENLGYGKFSCKNDQVKRLVLVDEDAAHSNLLAFAESPEGKAIVKEQVAAEEIKSDQGSGYDSWEKVEATECSASYPGSTSVFPPNFGKGECSCVVDPRLQTSLQAWTCPSGSALTFDSVKSKSAPNQGMSAPQYHCVAKYTEKIPMSEPMVCPTLFEVKEREGIAVCVNSNSACPTPNDKPLDSETGVLGAADHCDCEESFTLKCAKGTTFVPAGKEPAKCTWFVPTPKTVITKPICKYTKFEHLEFDVHKVKKINTGSLSNKMSCDAPQTSTDDFNEPEPIEGEAKPTLLEGKDWALTYSVPMRCPMVIDIPPEALVCGPVGDGGIFKLLNVIIAMQTISETYEFEGAIWSTCKNWCSTIYARATETAYDPTQGNGFSSAMEPCTKYSEGGKAIPAEKIKINYQSCLRDTFFDKTYSYFDEKANKGKGKIDTKTHQCLAHTGSNDFSFITKKAGCNTDNAAKNLYTSNVMGNNVLSKLSNFERIIRSGIASHPHRAMTKCLPKIKLGKKGGIVNWSHRTKDGPCEKNHKELIDWDRTLGKLRSSVEDVVTSLEKKSTSNPFAIDCRAVAKSVFGKEQNIGFFAAEPGKEWQGTHFPFPQTFPSCLATCMSSQKNKNGPAKTSRWNQMMDVFKALWPEYSCDCGKVWVRQNTKGKCQEKIMGDVKGGLLKMFDDNRLDAKAETKSKKSSKGKGKSKKSSKSKKVKKKN